MVASFDASDRSGRSLPRLGSGQSLRGTLAWKVALSAFAGLLVTIAVFQYRWINQIKDDMQDRARSGLETSAAQWRRDLYHALYTICGTILADPDLASQDGWEDYLQRYSTWRHQEYHYNPPETLQSGASLIANVYIWETGAGATPKLFLLNTAKNRIESADIPSPLEPLLARLQDRSQNYEVALRAWELPKQAPAADKSIGSAKPQDPHYTGWQINQNVPALVHPIVHRSRPMAHSSAPASARGPVDWMVIVLDRETIQKAILPQLVKRNFTGRRGLGYKVAVIAPGLPQSTIYSTDPGFPAEGTHDASMNIFGNPAHSSENWGAGASNSSGWSNRDDILRLAGPGWQWFPVIQYGSGTASWMLVVQRRSGPIDAAVHRVWRINFFSGMAVLLLLAASVGLIVVATRRAQYLARLQMNFVTGVSHELRTPLAVMLSAAENIADGVVDKPADVREHGRIIIGQGRFLSDLVDRILLFSAGNAGITSEPSQPVNVSEVVDRVVQNLAGPIRSAGIYVERDIQPSLPCVLADPVVLYQCLQNLVVNAIKYRGERKWISISAELSNSGQSSSEIQINVQDRGIGIRESELNSICEPFYRSPEVVARQIQGTGLGLSVVRRSVLEMGGRLRVASTFASGSTFTICLPVAPAKTDETAARASKVNGVPV